MERRMSPYMSLRGNEFIEVTTKAGKKRLVKVDCIEGVIDSTDGNCKIIRVGNSYEMDVKESYEDVKKLLGIAISPRGETLMKGV